MYTLSKEQIALIESDVALARITLNQLSDELIDHICCTIEEEMWQGKSFEEAYECVRKDTGIEVLKKIQEDTLYLTDKNYRIMKSTLKITGNLSLALLSFGTLFKIMHWPGASIALLLGFTVMVLVSFPSAIYLYHKEVKEKSRTALSISILIGGIVTMVGFLFKIMHWPAAGAILQIGLGLIIFVFLPLLLIAKVRESDTLYEKVMYITGTFALMIFELAFTFKVFHWPGAMFLMVVGATLLVAVFLPMFAAKRYKDHASLTGEYIFVVILVMYLMLLTILVSLSLNTNILQNFTAKAGNNAAISAYYLQDAKSANAPEELKRSGKELRACILQLQLRLIQETEGVDQQEALKRLNNPYLLIAKDNFDIPNHILFAKESNFIEVLRSKMRAFESIAVKTTPSLASDARKILSTENTLYQYGEKGNELTIRLTNSTLINTLEALGDYSNFSLVIEDSFGVKN